MNIKKIAIATVAVHVTLFVLSTLIGAVGTFGGLIEPVSWPIFSIGAVVSSAVIAIGLPIVQGFLDKLI